MRLGAAPELHRRVLRERGDVAPAKPNLASLTGQKEVLQAETPEQALKLPPVHVQAGTDFRDGEIFTVRHF